MKEPNFKCISCGIEKYIRPSNLSRYKYCSIECKVKSNEIMVKCPGCTKEFFVQKYDVRGHNKYCSWVCYKKEISTLRKLWWDTNPKEKRKYSNRFKKQNNPQYKDGKYIKKQLVCQICNKVFVNEATYKFCSQNCFGVFQAQNQKLYVNSRYGFRKDLNCWFRSAWEANIARYLNMINKRWIYEGLYIALPNGMKYLPDFYLPEENKYIEVKGYFSEKSKEKVNLASNMCNLELILPKEYYNIEKIFSGKIKYWEY